MRTHLGSFLPGQRSLVRGREGTHLRAGHFMVDLCARMRRGAQSIHEKPRLTRPMRENKRFCMIFARPRHTFIVEHRLTIGGCEELRRYPVQLQKAQGNEPAVSETRPLAHAISWHHVAGSNV